MQTKTLALGLNSPAFLGGASQAGAWRTPPSNALLREWWRIASASTFNYKHASMREAEGLLFGNAWLDDRFCKSQVRIALVKGELRFRMKLDTNVIFVTEDEGAANNEERSGEMCLGATVRRADFKLLYHGAGTDPDVESSGAGCTLLRKGRAH
jgi:hypothetical protein